MKLRRKVYYHTIQSKRRMKSVKTTAVLICLIFLAIATVTGIAQASEWIEKADTHKAGGYGEAVVGTGNNIYIVRCYNVNDNPSFWRYDSVNNSWDSMNTSGLSKGAFRNGAALAYDHSDYIYALLGGSYSDTNRTLFYRYNISNDSWEKLIDTPHTQGAGDAITWYNNQIYAFLGSKEHGTAFSCYNISNNSWSTLPLNPNWTTTDDGASLVWTGGDYLYALRGEWQETVPCQDYARYHISTKTWEGMEDIPESEGVGDGGSLLWVNNYSDYIYALGGNSCLEVPGYNFYRYSISSDIWEELEPIPCPVGNYVGNRLGFADGHIYYWQGSPTTEKWVCGGNAIYMFELTAEDKIFDNGIWWIKKDSKEPHLGWMKVYIDGKYKGECSRLDFGHKVEEVDSWPTVAVIYASGYIRLKECKDPDMNFGTSFVLGPGYWEGSNYYHNVTVEEIHINSSRAFELQIKAKQPHFNVNYNIEMFKPDKERMKIHVNQICECTNQLTLNESRLKEQEGFKIAQLSSMYIDETYHDSDGAKYIDESGKLLVRKFEDLKTNQFVFDNHKRLGECWLECTHSDNYGWQGNTPNCIIYLDNLTLAKECTPQGWITITNNPNNDNIGLWIQDKTCLEWDVGDKLSISYWLIAQDDPQIAIFDTKSPANPYPSISGTHNGMIKLNQTIEVSKLYTYPCDGSGGHTEYAKIYNESWSIETSPWEGYTGDWHNISFTDSFKLSANVEYNYTIKTGSYPQIHHTNTLSTVNGWINCTEFVDANGKKYSDWIPAIKLE